MNIDPNLVLLAIAMLNAITALLAWRTHNTAVRTQSSVVIVERATNGMKEALVKATGDAQFAAGRHEARLEGEVKAAAVAEGRLEGQK